MSLKNPLIIILLLILFSANAQTQNLVERLNRGVAAHQQYNLVACDSILSNVLAKKERLSQAQYGEGLYFFSRNLFRMAAEEGKGTTGFVNTQVQLKIFRAYNSFLLLEKLAIPRWSEKAAPEIQGMFETLLQASVQCLEKYVQDKENTAFYKQIVQGYLNLAIAIKGENYASYELFGQLCYLEENYADAKNYFDLAIEKYQAKRVLMTDNIRMPIVYYSSALICLYQQPKKAYYLAKKGYKVNELEWNTLNANLDKLGPTTIMDNKALYFNNQYNLGLLELELSHQVNMDKDSAVVLFKERERYYQDEYSFHFNYALWLEDVNPRDASMHYQKAIDLAPNFFEAQYRIGALYFKMGYYYLDLAKIEKAKAKEHNLRAEQLLNTGIPYMQKAVEINPKSVLALNLLVQVLSDLKNDKLLDYYKSRLSEL